MTKPSAKEKVAAFRSINRALTALEMAWDFVDMAKQLHPEMDPKYFKQIIVFTDAISAKVPR